MGAYPSNSLSAYSGGTFGGIPDYSPAEDSMKDQKRAYMRLGKRAYMRLGKRAYMRLGKRDDMDLRQRNSGEETDGIDLDLKHEEVDKRARLRLG